MEVNLTSNYHKYSNLVRTYKLSSTKNIFIDRSALLFREPYIWEKRIREQVIGKFELKQHVKSAFIWNCSGPHFPTFGLDLERYGVSLRIQSECGKMQTRITPNTDTFHTVLYSIILSCYHVNIINFFYCQFVFHSVHDLFNKFIISYFARVICCDSTNAK